MIYRAIVADSRDPAGKNRLRVMVPALSGQAISDWIWPVVRQGVLPSAGEQVWILFENGDQDFPVWLGTKSVLTTSDLTISNAEPSAPGVWLDTSSAV